jgi:hypothetical protein
MTRIPQSAALAILCSGLLCGVPANAQSGPTPGFGVGNIHEGLAIGAIAGVAAVAGIGITWLVLHNRGVVVGCVTESAGKNTLVDSGGKVYTLSEAGPPLPVGERAKLKGHKSGSAAAPAFQVRKILKDYGRCQP